MTEGHNIEWATKDIVTAVIASLGLGVSIVTFWLTQMRKSKLDAVIGPIIEFFHPPDGATRFFLPVCTENLIRIDWGRESPNVSAQ
jgi:hypothetical protein